MEKKKGKIKLVQIIADSDLSGGPTHVLGILRNIDKRKFDLFLISPSGNLPNEAEKLSSVAVIKIPMRSKFDMEAKKKIFETLSQIQSDKNPFGPMIVHTHGPRAGLLGRMAIPTGALSVYTEHRWDADYSIGGINEWFQKKVLKKLNNKTNLIIAVSSAVKEYLVETNMAPKERIITIPNAIDAEKFKGNISKSKRRIAHSNHPPHLGSVGNLNPQKGYEYLIKAMKQIVDDHPHATLEIIGDGPEKKNLSNLIKELKLEHNVTLMGRKSDPLNYVKKWDVFVLSSVAETFGIVLLEAMSVSVPIVATKVGGVKDVIENGKSGMLIPAKNPKEIAEAVDELLRRPALAAQLIRGGKERLKKFDWDKVVKRLEDEYVRLSKEF